ncbi:MAG: site-2 protease family protein [Candidatus Micrarchaeota archaeon]|nr:site-2 protease family protein [Candidatus Micrarchaeota archaeon]
MKNKGKTAHLDLAFAVFILIVSIFLFLTVLGSSVSAFLKFILSVAVLVGCGYGVSRAFSYECWYGIFLLRSQYGLSLLGGLAKKYPEFWQSLYELGMVIGFGSFAYFLLPRKNCTWKRIAFIYGLGTVLMVMFSYVIAPLATGALFSMLSGGAEFASAGHGLQTSVAQFAFAKYLFFGLLVLGGLSLMTTAGLLIYAFVVVASLIGAQAAGVSLSSVSPGGTPIIPGINLPLAEGIAALAVVLIVHEGMHGIVACMHNFPLKSAGLVFFGFLPFGAFVDIDEKKMFKGRKDAQSAVFVAGTTANFFTSLALVALLLAFSAGTQPFRLDGVYVEGGNLPHGAIIQSINGTPIKAIWGDSLSANATYSIQTSKGAYSLATDSNGKLGVSTTLADSSGELGVFRYAEGLEWMAFLMRFLALAFALNFVVGAINLVPLPLFDGYYLMKNAVGNELAVKLIAGAVAVAFMLNMLPWIFR